MSAATIYFKTRKEFRILIGNYKYVNITILNSHVKRKLIIVAARTSQVSFFV